ncbi:MAG: terminase [Hyphomicrobiales bacterium]|nr:terminase [Hyphomicrobiales bacterium]
MNQQEFDRKLADQFGRFYTDPLGFVLFAFPWGKKGTALEKYPDGPDKWTRRLFAALAEHTLQNLSRADRGEELKIFRSAVASGHGVGKSATVAWLIMWLMSTRHKCCGVVTAMTEVQLRTKTWPELAKWHGLAINRHWFKWTATQFYSLRVSEGERRHYTFNAITWSLDRTEGFQGLHNAGGAVVVIEDEASGIDDQISEVITGAFTDGEPFWFKFGNPTKNEGYFFECFHKYRKYWWTTNVDSREVRVSNKGYLEEVLGMFGVDSNEARKRVLGQFPRSDALQFIPAELVREAVARPTPPKDDGAPLIAGVDVAVGGGDLTVIRFRKGLDARSIPPIRLDTGDSIAVATKVAEAIDAWNPDAVFVDEIGVGKGVADILRQLGYRIIPVNAGPPADNRLKFRDKKAEMWADMKQWMIEGGALPDDERLFSDLIGPHYDHTLKMQLYIESKRDMRRRGLHSPDDADALALTFARRVGRTDLASHRLRRQTVAKDVDYDVFNVVG